MKPGVQRAGLSLFEVVLCLAVLTVSMSLLGQLLNAARSGAMRASLETEATLYAESVLAEVEATGTTPAAVDEQPIADLAGWTYSLATEATDWETLSNVTVTVRHRNNQDAIDAEVSLNRWLFCPAAE